MGKDRTFSEDEGLDGVGEVVGVLCTEQVRAEPGQAVSFSNAEAGSAALLTMARWHR